MKQSFVLLLAVLVVAGTAVGGCASKKTGGPGTGAPDEPTVGTVDTSPVKWAYDAAPEPVFTGTPDVRLTSFGFDEGAAVMKSEGMGACREAVKKISDLANAKILTVGFADGIKEASRGQMLGQQRAEAAKRFLGSLGLKPDQIQTTSFGTRYSTAKDFEKIKQGLERKVEVWLLQ